MLRARAQLLVGALAASSCVSREAPAPAPATAQAAAPTSGARPPTPVAAPGPGFDTPVSILGCIRADKPRLAGCVQLLQHVTRDDAVTALALSPDDVLEARSFGRLSGLSRIDRGGPFAMTFFFLGEQLAVVHIPTLELDAELRAQLTTGAPAPPIRVGCPAGAGDRCACELYAEAGMLLCEDSGAPTRARLDLFPPTTLRGYARRLCTEPETKSRVASVPCSGLPVTTARTQARGVYYTRPHLDP
ncbi:MAG: hypothetical protein KC636_23790 [Myxococcales bacterium]|nr:hypothetical protein [Myxococcales bacterium]